MGPTMDHQIIRDLFANTIEAARRSGRRRGPSPAKLDDLRSQIAPNQIGKHGQLQEWLEDKDDPKNEHRHVSHLWGLYPGRGDHAGDAGAVRGRQAVARSSAATAAPAGAGRGRSTSGRGCWTATTPT